MAARPRPIPADAKAPDVARPFRGQGTQPLWQRPNEVSVIVLPLVAPGDPERRRLEKLFGAMHSLKRALRRDVRSRLHAYWAASGRLRRDAAGWREELGLSRERLERRAYRHLERSGWLLGHASKALAPERHSHHQRDSPGNRCTACHMPFLQHQGVGTQLVYSRADHTIPIPRPAFDRQLGLENACQKCHPDRELSWQEEKVKEWYGEVKPHHEMIGRLLKARDTTDPKAAEQLLLVPAAKHPMASIPDFVVLETAFTAVQFLIVGPLIAFAHRN